MEVRYTESLGCLRYILLAMLNIKNHAPILYATAGLTTEHWLPSSQTASVSSSIS